MTDRLLLDTHIILWLENGDSRLRVTTRSVIDQCWKAGGTVLLSAVSAWEIALLVDIGRIELDVSAPEWVERFIDYPGIEIVPLDHRAATRSYKLDGLEHRDPADRLLIATAIELDCPLVSYDERIVRFAAAHGHRYGFTASA